VKNRVERIKTVKPSNESSNRPSIGIAVVVVKNNKILLGEDKRKGQALYGVPGGHWETGESLKQGARREVKEECGLDCGNIKLISVYDFYREDKKKNYITIGMKADYFAGRPTNLESEGRTNWKWYKPENALRLQLFPPDRVLIERFISGIVFE
jgi:8-oxo-dGTP diphosphatase